MHSKIIGGKQVSQFIGGGAIAIDMLDNYQLAKYLVSQLTAAAHEMGRKYRLTEAV